MEDAVAATRREDKWNETSSAVKSITTQRRSRLVHICSAASPPEEMLFREIIRAFSAQPCVTSVARGVSYRRSLVHG